MQFTYSFNYDTILLWGEIMAKTMFVILILWNIFVFIAYGLDKFLSKRKSRRISEGTLIALAFLMGGIGAMFGMELLRHKTRTAKFRMLIPVAVILNIIIIVILKDI